MLIQVITSWQVLVATGVIVIYISIVNYVARLQHHSSRKPLVRKPRRKKSEATPTPEAEELGLEESVDEN